MIDYYFPNGKGLKRIIRMNKIVSRCFNLACIRYRYIRHDLQNLSHSFAYYSDLSLDCITKHTVIKKYLVFPRPLGKIQFDLPNCLHDIL